MADKKFFDRQISLTEWLSATGHNETSAHRDEDNQKRERLAILNKVIGLPFDRPIQFTLQDVVNKTDDFVKYFQAHGDDLCALRLIPDTPDLPKLRMRGQTVHDVVTTWLPEQAVDHSHYRADFVPHADITRWATIFVINEKEMRGEIIADTHEKLTQGYYEVNSPISFSYNFSTKSWYLEPANPEAEAHLTELLKYLLVPKEKQIILKEELNSEFAHEHLQGYFETVDTDQGLWFIDYNRLLHRDIPSVQKMSNETALQGQVASRGTHIGLVQVVESPQETDFPDGAVLVCDMTSPDYLPLMQKAGAIVTNRGGVTSHAAIVARELKVPCIVGVKNATSELATGNVVKVDAEQGSIEVVS